MQTNRGVYALVHQSQVQIDRDVPQIPDEIVVVAAQRHDDDFKEAGQAQPLGSGVEGRTAEHQFILGTADNVERPANRVAPCRIEGDAQRNFPELA
ncbi:hypothetical protein [Breoghania sp.]|uniref:hypothetical protein n=1 Tax=Breoghania sp. TaxID=2065378 RepID=UPI00260AA8C9|nr:hypothetical protein [Breoghania sp.]MDJ0933366.1 hypothetical protein [Breoghania sp.]